MKRWTPQEVEKFFKLTKKEIKAPREKMPFPGQFPTRVYFRVGKQVRALFRRNGVQEKNVKEFLYLGKPCYIPSEVFSRRYRENPWDYTSIEFDRGGPIAIDHRTPEQNLVAINDELWTKYHPHQNWNTPLIWMSYNFKLGKSGWYVVGKDA